MESTDAGCAQTLFSLTSAAAVTCGIMKPELVRRRARGTAAAFAESGVHQAFDAAFADSGQCAECDGEKIEREG